MHCVQTLPADYRLLYRVDLQKDKKLALLINGLAGAVALLMGFGMHWFIPIGTLFDLSDGMGAYFLRFGVLLAGMVVYIIAHEWVHGQAMKRYGAQKVDFGFTGLYAFAGSKVDYFDKHAYRVIALAPVVLWGVVLLILNVLVPIQWFWVVYLIQISNISGAMGDLFVTVKFSRFPADILVQDSGVGMQVYTREA